MKQTSLAVTIICLLLYPYQTNAQLTLRDGRDGQTYRTAIFGAAGEWMTENLAYEPKGVTYAPNTEENTNTPYYYAPNNLSKEAAKAPTYNGSRIGFLYSWAAAMNLPDGAVTVGEGRQGICPSGWHLPTDFEWTALETEIANNPSLYSYSSGKLTTGYTGNSGASFKSTEVLVEVLLDNYELTNATSKSSVVSGFNALLVGGAAQGATNSWGINATFWSSSSGSTAYAYDRYVYYSDSNLYRNTLDNKYSLSSVRCVRN
ncbi:MAG: hypothetical protein LBN93_08945 [Candidatus Symbiothrix sp.]|jgi:uncharacterized protein (TIGR02145 family)|nr:hypothetical protein [Candidatus Symbiothrix sp.]